MKKQISLFFLTALLAACSTKTPTLLNTQSPILNIEAPAAARVEAGVNRDNAWVKNKTGRIVDLAYSLFWYDKNGVTTLAEEQPTWHALTLQPMQKQTLTLSRPSADSVNYRLYIRLK
ncbi:YcfL family protein [Aggregatibacter kilianii]|uniref:YcfL family protein n=1 Tax=Aggregatibacter kilianii TaxID=2025884 RepID=UPI000D6563D7|nr:YcfL family protein [Aggregatibacter kilianii]